MADVNDQRLPLLSSQLLKKDNRVMWDQDVIKKKTKLKLQKQIYYDSDNVLWDRVGDLWICSNDPGEKCSPEQLPPRF